MSDIVSTAVFRAQADTNSARREWTSFGGSIKSAGAVVAAALAATAAAAAGVGLAFAKFARESQAQEVIFTRLRTSVESTGRAYADVASDLDSFFAERQRFTQFGDDATAALTASIISLTAATGASLDEVKELTSLAQDMSVALGVDASTAADALAKAFAGNTQAIARMLPAHRDALDQIAKIPDASERARQSIGLLSGQFSGAATQVDAYTLATSRLNNGMGDLREALGDLVTRNVQVQGAISAAADSLDSFVSTMSTGSAQAQTFGSIVGSAFLGAARMATMVTSSVLTMADAIHGTTVAASQLLGITGDPHLERQQQNLNRFIELSERALNASDAAERAAARTGARALARGGDLGQLDTRRLQEEGVPLAQQRTELARLIGEARQLEQQIGMGRGRQLESESAVTIATTEARNQLAILERQLIDLQAQGGLSAPGGGGGAGSASDIAERTAARTREGGEIRKVIDLVAGLQAEEEKARQSYLRRKDEIDAGIASIVSGATAATHAFVSAAGTVFADFAEGSAAITAQIASKQAEHNAALVEEHMAFVRMLSEDTFATINGGMLDLVSTTTDGFAAMVIAGESAGSALGGPLLKSLGNIAKQMGTVFLTASGGLTALFALSPIGLAAAGGALLVIGSTLGALGGVVSSKGKGASRGPVGDSGLRAMTSTASGQTTQTIVDARGAVFVSDDPATTRNMIRRLDEGRERGGSGRV